LAEELLASQQGLCTIELVKSLCLHSDLHRTDEVLVAVKSLLAFFLVGASIYFCFFIILFFLWNLELKFFAVFWDSTALYSWDKEFYCLPIIIRCHVIECKQSFLHVVTLCDG
jgi:hypothetical protein